MKTLSKLVLTLCLVTFLTPPAWSATYEFPSAQELDNMEEYVSDGNWDAGSSDLEIGYEKPDGTDQKQQIVGLRFPNVVIPEGEIIINAYIQFTTDENKNDNPFLATIYGEAIADAPVFEEKANSVSSRTKTIDKVYWSNPAEWTSEGERGEAQQTPDLLPIISEITDNGWTNGNAMVFIIEATGTRTAVSYKKAAELGIGYENFAPTLVIVTDVSTVSYQPLASDDDAEEGDDGAGVLDIDSSDLEITMDHEDDPSRNQTIGLRFRNVSIPQGAQVLNAYIQFNVDENDKNVDPFKVTITGEDNSFPEEFKNTAYNISGRDRTSTTVNWEDIPAWTVTHAMGIDQRTPDLTTIVQEIVDREDWVGGNNMALILEGTGQRSAESFDGAGDNTEQRPTLVIKFVGQEELIVPSVEKVRAMWNDDPATTMVVGWNQLDGESPVLKWGPTDHERNAGAYPNTLDPYKENTVLDMHTYFAKFTGLTPDTYYYFVIQDSEGISERFYFLTAPDTKQPFTCIIGGDTKNSGTAYAAAQLSNEMVSKLRPLFVQFNGDYCSDNGTNPSYWDAWLDNWSEQTTTDDGRLIPHIAVHGNHENGNYEVLHQLFDTPATNGDPYDYYALTFADKLLKTFVLNSELQNGDTWAAAFARQNNWLAAELEASADVDFLVSGYHKPLRPHTSGKSENPTLIASWAELFYNYGMDISTDADSHMFKYTFPLAPCSDDDPECFESFKKDEEFGTFYFGEGSWGAGPRANDDDKPWTIYSGSFYQFKWLHVYPAAGEEPAHIDIRTIVTASLDDEGALVDHVDGVGNLTEENKYTAIPENINILDVPFFGTEMKIPFTLNDYDAALPEAPEKLAGVETSYTEIDLTWEYNSEVPASAFELEYRIREGDWTVLNNNIASSSTGISLSQLQDDTDYDFRMRARNLFGYSDYTAVASVTLEKDPTIKVELQQDLDGYDGAVDLELRSWDPDNVIEGTDAISVDMSDGGGVNHGLMLFKDLVSSIPEGSTVTKAELQVRTTSSSSGTQSFYRMLTEWPEECSWNTLGGDGVTPDDVEATAAAEGTTDSPSSGEYTYIDVTDSVNAWLSGAPNYGWGIINSSTDGWDFNTAEYESLSRRPKLTIFYIAKGDLNEDGYVDRNDVNIIKTYMRQPASDCPECDIDEDGSITVLDARKLINLCTCDRCVCP